MRPEPRKKDTPTQFLMASWVKEAGFGSILEYDFEPYVVDIYIPDLLLALEIDGPYHMVRRDAYRDAYILTTYNIANLNRGRCGLLNKLLSELLHMCANQSLRSYIAYKRNAYSPRAPSNVYRRQAKRSIRAAPPITFTENVRQLVGWEPAEIWPHGRSLG